MKQNFSFSYGVEWYRREMSLLVKNVAHPTIKSLQKDTVQLSHVVTTSVASV
jgi:hypothetical protein